jgi:6-phosphofructokinase 1
LIKLETQRVHITVFFVEVMGRDAGHIALNAGIGAGAEDSYPGRGLRAWTFVRITEKSKASGKSSSIVVIAEGDKIGKNVLN